MYSLKGTALSLAKDHTYLDAVARAPVAEEAIRTRIKPIMV
jgi:hypothetical protein